MWHVFFETRCSISYNVTVITWQLFYCYWVYVLLEIGWQPRSAFLTCSSFQCYNPAARNLQTWRSACRLQRSSSLSPVS